MGQIAGAHSLRGPTAARKRSRTNWKNINKAPNPAKQEKAEMKRAKRRERNLDNNDREFVGRWYKPVYIPFHRVWLYGMPSVRQDFKK